MKNEPVLAIFGQLEALLVAIVGAVVAFGFELSNEQTGAIITVGSIVLGLISAFFVRQQVSPVNEDTLPPHGHVLED